jgi:hypothetical protein
MAQNLKESFIEPVPLHDVKLEYNSQYDKAVSLNKEYILGIETNRLLKTFRYHAPTSSPIISSHFHKWQWNGVLESCALP